MSEIERPENLSFKNAPIELKEDGDTRYIEAVFSLFDTIDSDNDVTKANALRSGYTGKSYSEELFDYLTQNVLL